MQAWSATSKRIGLYHSKARHIIAACKILVEQHGGEVPRTREALESLPGVGRKTANVILNTAFGEPTIAVDTHIFRVANRIGIAPGKTVLEVERKLLKFIPEEFLQGRTPLAHPTWALCVQGAQTELSRMHAARLVRVQAENPIQRMSKIS